MKIAVVGATGLVGSAMLKVLEERNFPVSELIPVASEKSVGKEIEFKGKKYKVHSMDMAIAAKPQIALFSAGGDTSKEWAPKFAAAGITVIDNSSAWRMDPTKKLVVPEVNAHVLTKEDKIIANPNCSTIQMVVVLNPLHKKYSIKRVVVSTYQSVTGTGVKAVNQLMNERKGVSGEMAYKYPIDLNVIPQIDVFTDNGYTKEEMKMVNETKKIMGDDAVKVTATTVRIPVMGGHSEALNIEFVKEPSVAEIREMMKNTEGVILEDDPSQQIYPMPMNSHNKDEVFVGRIRLDETQANTINMWVVADNLRKGAATNAVQIAEYLLKKQFSLMPVIPPYLQKGDTVAIVATARKITLEELQPAIDIINAWGLKVVLPKNIFCVDNQFAGTDEERAADMQWALDEANVKAVICARGGYGTVRIIDKLDFANFAKHPKWIVGYSDITVLHQHIKQNFSIASLHATMPINFTKNEEATESLRKALFGEELIYTIPTHPLNKVGEASGELIGGNLSLTYALCGSKSDIDTKGKILFIEDLDEYLYHIDRMMMNLKRSGKLQHLAGLIVGGMSDMKDNTVPFGKTAEEIILDAVKEYNYPVCFNFPAGHIDRNLALVMGKKVELHVTSEQVDFNTLTSTKTNPLSNDKTFLFFSEYLKLKLFEIIFFDHRSDDITFEEQVTRIIFKFDISFNDVIYKGTKRLTKSKNFYEFNANLTTPNSSIQTYRNLIDDLNSKLGQDNSWSPKTEFDEKDLEDIKTNIHPGGSRHYKINFNEVKTEVGSYFEFIFSVTISFNKYDNSILTEIYCQFPIAFEEKAINLKKDKLESLIIPN